MTAGARITPARGSFPAAGAPDDLTAAQREMVRQRIYFARYTGDAPARLDRCRTAISGSGLRQCDRTPKEHRGGWCLCPAHAKAWDQRQALLGGR